MSKVRDLRSALELLENMPNQLIETDVEVDPMAELSGVYRYVGAGGTVQRPTKEGPAMIFNNVKGHPDARVLIGLLASRKRVAALLDTESENLGKLLYKSVDNPIQPVLTDKVPLCQEVVHKATDEDFDLYKLVPAPTNTPDDAGPYITLGMCYASHPDTGCSDVTIHRTSERSVLANKGYSSNSQKKSNHANLHRTKRRTRIYGRNSNRSEHLRNGRKSNARQTSKRILLISRRRKIHGSASI